MTAGTRSDDSFGVYVHVPYCQVQCPYCTFFTVPLPQRQASFRRLLRALQREWQQRVRPRLRRGDALRTLYLGGGTPSDVPPALLEEFLAQLAEDLPRGFAALEEVTVECNPESVTPPMLATLRRLGVSRVSLGVQSVLDAELRRLGRGSTRRDVLRALAAVAQEFRNWSADLIVGIPGGDRRRLRRSLESLESHGAPHVSFYCLELPPERAARLGGKLWSERRLAQGYVSVSTWLKDHGFEHYEISSAARPGKRALHNGAYWEGRDYVGLGPAAHSLAGNERRANRADLRSYLQAMEAGRQAPARRETLTAAMLWEERLLLGLRRREGISLDSLGLGGGRAFFEALVTQGQGWLDEDRFGLTPAGWLVSDSIILQIVTSDIRPPERVDKPQGRRYIRPSSRHRRVLNTR